MSMIKESEIDELSVLLNGLRISHLLAGHWVELSLKNDTTANPIPCLTDLNETEKTRKQEEIEALLSKIVHGHTKTVLLGNNMYVMTQAPEKGKEPCLPHGLSMANTYIEMATGSRCIAIVIKNQTAAPVIINMGVKVTWVEAANGVPLIDIMPGTLEKIDKMHGIQWTKMSSRYRKETLLQQLDLSGLEGCSGVNHTCVYALLTKYYYIISLEPGKLGCTGLAKHEIRAVDDEIFKDIFQRIPPSMVEEVRAHIKGMLEAGALCPTQTPWCSDVMLVRKKGGGLHFCIDLCKLKVRAKKIFIHSPAYKRPLRVL